MQPVADGIDEPSDESALGATTSKSEAKPSRRVPRPTCKNETDNQIGPKKLLPTPKFKEKAKAKGVVVPPPPKSYSYTPAPVVVGPRPGFMIAPARAISAPPGGPEVPLPAPAPALPRAFQMQLVRNRLPRGFHHLLQGPCPPSNQTPSLYGIPIRLLEDGRVEMEVPTADDPDGEDAERQWGSNDENDDDGEGQWGSNYDENDDDDDDDAGNSGEQSPESPTKKIRQQ